MINPDLLRRALLAPKADNSAVLALEDLLGCKTWLHAAQNIRREGQCRCGPHLYKACRP
ncbi:MAG: hypothetical protein ACRDTH_19650 [Pseudonocardiaceae bacterium]